MSNYAELYWLTRLDGLTDLFAFSSFMIGATLLFTVIFQSVSTANGDDEMSKPLKKYNRIAIPIFIVFVLLKVFTPTQNEAVLIIAGGRTLDYIESDSSIQNIPSQTTAIVSEYLEKTLKELEKENGK